MMTEANVLDIALDDVAGDQPPGREALDFHIERANGIAGRIGMEYERHTHPTPLTRDDEKQSGR